ncbi:MULTISPECIES: hypothetical protein [unclassified Streptomyces]|uniref:hypothetical protein n=1 Tax=unclassified Streptomyces TaxID=2593676 RepID=UPI001CBAAF34|nr:MULTISPECIES: hypothetical protein [unclassified Streptomyces]WPO71641.1 hypothetical protein R9806_13870 [Streptomyces sp. KN37]
MALHDELTAVQRCVEELVRTVGRLESQAGDQLAGVDVRRVRTDTDRLTESVALLRSAAAPSTPREKPLRTDLVTIPDTPYDSSLWTNAGDCDDEGLGAHHRHAP